MKKVLLLAAAILACASCGGQRVKKTAGTEPAGEAIGETAAAVTYVPPKIPALITEPEDKSDWLSRHFWDGFDFADTTLMGSRAEYAERAFVDYTQLLHNIPTEMGDESLRILFDRTATDKAMFLHMAGVAEKYLFDANSPYRDDELYIMTLNAVLANPSLDEWERIRPQEQLRISLKNRVGRPAADFRYTLASGASGTLYGLRSPYTLLFINNPGCPSCLQTQGQIMSSEFLGRLVEEGTLTVLAIYPDEDLAAWREHATHIPGSWINSYDKALAIKQRELYDLKAIPTLYLLDASKKVMLKDVMSIPLIEQTIYNDNRQ